MTLNLQRELNIILREESEVTKGKNTVSEGD
jgi:hypothetical protein